MMAFCSCVRASQFGVRNGCLIMQGGVKGVKSG
jgi:hypothetical protein